MRLASNTISIVFHPFFLPSYALLVLFQVNPYMFSNFDGGMEARLLVIVLINTMLFPFLTIGLMKKIGFVKTLQLEDRFERILPYIAGCLFYFWCYMSIKSLPIGYVPAQLMLGATFGVFGTFFFNLFFKISAHAAAMGGFLGFLVMVYPHSVFNLDWLIFAVILLGAIVSSARYYLGMHTFAQLAAGYVVGYFAQWAAFTFF